MAEKKATKVVVWQEENIRIVSDGENAYYETCFADRMGNASWGDCEPNSPPNWLLKKVALSLYRNKK